MSLFLGVVGAILRFAVSVETRGFNVHMMGLILMTLGVFGVVISLMFRTMSGGSNSNNRISGRDTVAVGIGITPRRRTTVVAREVRS